VTSEVIELVNRFSAVSDEDVEAYTNAQNVQFTRDVAPIWGICPNVTFRPGASKPSPNAIPAWLSDTLDVDGALGYHDEDKGVPYIKVANVDGYDWRTTASHECLELKGDQPANVWALGPKGSSMVAYELCDPVEGDSYEINGIPMSNFVLPAWFDPQAPAGSRFDFLGKLSKPFTMSAGGYLIVWTVRGQPTEQFGAHVREIAPNLHVHFGPDVSEKRREGIVSKYKKTGRRAPK